MKLRYAVAFDFVRELIDYNYPAALQPSKKRQSRKIVVEKR